MGKGSVEPGFSFPAAEWTLTAEADRSALPSHGVDSMRCTCGEVPASTRACK